jgi:membrane associated rhomboid family serine protease
MLSELANDLNLFITKSQLFIRPWLICLGVLWLINIFNWITGSRLNNLGIYPRRMSSLTGIIFSPILHQGFNHLFFNSIPLFVLGLVILGRGINLFYWVTAVVVLLSGSLVWLLGRKALHIGASGLISGYFGFIMITAYTNPSAATLLLALVVLYYFGSIFLGIFPQQRGISWESHLLGFLAGIAAAYLSPAMITRFLSW